MTATLSLLSSRTTTSNSNINLGITDRDYLSSIIEFSIYLQINLNKTKQLKNNADSSTKERPTISRIDYVFVLFSIESELIYFKNLTNIRSVLDLNSKTITDKKLSKNSRHQERRDTLLTNELVIM